MQLVADDLEVRPLLAEHLDRGLGHRLPERVVLPDDVDLRELLVLLDDVGEGGHLHVGVGVEAEVPVLALLVRQRRVHRRVVEVEDAVLRVALVVLEDRVRDRVGDPRAVALEHEADALADDLLELDQALLRAHLVVEPHDLELLAQHVARSVDVLDLPPKTRDDVWLVDPERRRVVEEPEGAGVVEQVPGELHEVGHGHDPRVDLRLRGVPDLVEASELCGEVFGKVAERPEAVQAVADPFVVVAD